MKRLFTVVTYLVIVLPVFAQSRKLQKADAYYAKLSYVYAIELYEQLIGTAEDTPEMKGRLATSYYKIGDTRNAEKYYTEMIQTPAATKEDFFNYSQVLKQNGNYELSDQWMTRFHESVQSDTRGISFVNDPSYIRTIEAQGIRFLIHPFPQNSQATDFGGYPSADGSHIYFVSSRTSTLAVHRECSWNGGHFLDLYTTETDQNGETDKPKLVSGHVNSRYHEGPLCFSPDGKTVYFTRNNVSKGTQRRDAQGIQNLKLYRATIAADGSWKNEESLPFNSPDYSVGHPAISADGSTLYFVSDKPSGFGGTDIYKVAIKTDGTYGEPQNLGAGINTEGQEMFPWISNEGNLFFASNGHIGLGGLDVFVVLPTQNGWSKAINAGKPVNSQHDDFAFTMNKDNRTGYFSSNRDGGTGGDDIYTYELLRPFNHHITLEGIITDQRTGDILPGSIVEITTGNDVLRAVADEKGHYHVELQPDMEYTVLVKRSNYHPVQTAVTTSNADPGVSTIRKDISIDRDPELALYALITDSKTDLPLEGVQIEITDTQSGQLIVSALTSQSGDILKALENQQPGTQLTYSIRLSKPGYLGKTLDFSYTLIEPGVIKINSSLDLSLNKLEVGTDLGALIDIKPIYFDYAKYAIRKDAALELDKIVKIMNEYPTMEIELGSHTDCRGTEASNKRLSDNRAMASATYIKARITNPQRIYGKGYGESKLRNGCACEDGVKSDCSEEAHQENRRTEFVIIRM